MNDQLAVALSAAVPIWAHRLKKEPLNSIMGRVGEYGKILAEKGDLLLYPSKKQGETADLFNKCAEGIAALSFMQGGITIFGSHWENIHPDLEPVPSETPAP